PHRTMPTSVGDAVRLSEVVSGDDVELASLWWTGIQRPDQRPADDALKGGAPLHLINVTINETIDGRTGIQNRDRRGIGMAIGPAGLSAGVRHHLVLERGKTGFTALPTGSGFQMFKYETTFLRATLARLLSK